MITESGNLQGSFGSMTAAQLARPMPTDLRSGENFTDYLSRQLSQPAAEPLGSVYTNTPEEAHAKARKAAEGLVSNALILPILKQIRQHPIIKNTIFSPGIGEKTFGPEFDMQIADRIAQSPQMSVTAALTRRLESRGQSTLSQSKNVSPGVNVHG